jgi:replication initiation protein RepC
MNGHSTTTPFGRRPVTLGQIATQMGVISALGEAAKPGSNTPTAVNKWQLFRTLTEIRERLGVSDRSLSLLSALLTFYPEAELSLPDQAGKEGQGAATELVVFPSNRQLSLRAHGMAEPSIRRHLAALVDAGLIIRRDSPNGKRYARRAEKAQDRFSEAYGFDLTPLVIQAGEFDAALETVRREQRAIRVLKERITLHRRDISKMIALGVDEALLGPWEAFKAQFMGLLTPLRRLRSPTERAETEAKLAVLKTEITNCLESNFNARNTSGNDDHFERHISDSNTNSILDFEPASKEEGANVSDGSANNQPAGTKQKRDLPLGLVLEACPDIATFNYGGDKIRNWQEFIAAARELRPMIGISPDAWRDAVDTMGEGNAAIAVACILQRSEHSSEAKAVPGKEPGSTVIAVNGSPAIYSAGGYLRALTEKARAGELALGPILMALIGQRLKEKRRKHEERR